MRPVKDILNSKTIIWAHLLLDIRRGTAGTKFGYLWWFLDPLIMMAIFYFIVHILFDRGGEGYHLFILSGLVAWQGFSRSLLGATRALSQAASVLMQTRVSAVVLVVPSILSNAFFVLIGFVVVLAVSGGLPSVHVLWVIPILMLQSFLTFVVGLFTSILNVFIPDVARVLGFVLRAMWFMSPVLYEKEMVMESDRVAEWMKVLFELNPFATIIPAYRDALLNGVVPDLAALGVVASVFAVLALPALAFFSYFEKRVIKFV